VTGISPPPDIFDEPPLHDTARSFGAISPLRRSDAAGTVMHTELRWRAALVAALLGIGVGVASNFPAWAVALLGLAGAALCLRALPSFVRRLSLIAIGSFFFAQCTTIFINVPFDWLARFLFCAVLIAGIAYLRVTGNE
jgi:hypothetical protein